MYFIPTRSSCPRAVLFGCVLLAACSTRVTTTRPPASVALANTALPRPDTIVVDDFTMDPNAVRVDQGSSGRLRRRLSGMTGSDARMRDVDAVRFGITDALTQAIRRMGLLAQEATVQPPPALYRGARARDLDQ